MRFSKIFLSLFIMYRYMYTLYKFTVKLTSLYFDFLTASFSPAPCLCLSPSPSPSPCVGTAQDCSPPRTGRSRNHGGPAHPRGDAADSAVPSSLLALTVETRGDMDAKHIYKLVSHAVFFMEAIYTGHRGDHDSEKHTERSLGQWPVY